MTVRIVPLRSDQAGESRVGGTAAERLALDRQTERIRAMTADEKVRVSHALWLEAKRVMATGVQATHPEFQDGWIRPASPRRCANGGDQRFVDASVRA
jgi:hypothetical protein